MAVWMLLSAPEHSRETSGWMPSMSSTLLASCFGPSSFFTVSWKSAPNSLATVRRSWNRSTHSEGGSEDKQYGKTERKNLCVALFSTVSRERCLETVCYCTGDDDLRGPHCLGHQQTDQPNRSCGERGNKQHVCCRTTDQTFDISRVLKPERESKSYWVLNSHTEASLFNLILDILSDH